MMLVAMRFDAYCTTPDDDATKTEAKTSMTPRDRRWRGARLSAEIENDSVVVLGLVRAPMVPPCGSSGAFGFATRARRRLGRPRRSGVERWRSARRVGSSGLGATPEPPGVARLADRLGADRLGADRLGPQRRREDRGRGRGATRVLPLKSSDSFRVARQTRSPGGRTKRERARGRRGWALRKPGGSRSPEGASGLACDST